MLNLYNALKSNGPTVDTLVEKLGYLIRSLETQQIPASDYIWTASYHPSPPITSPQSEPGYESMQTAHPHAIDVSRRCSEFFFPQEITQRGRLIHSLHRVPVRLISRAYHAEIVGSCAHRTTAIRVLRAKWEDKHVA